ncbi:MAG: Fn3-like domain-containing protein [Flavobacteriaceae bacterium]|nr:Fn3-like domain-containing protein [Flavobacteriaceae bacterium]
MRNNTIKSLFLFTTLISLFGFSTAYGQICNSELIVSQNRDARSASENDPTQFQLELTNNSSKSQTYDIKTARFEGSFAVKGVGKDKLASTSKLNVTIEQNHSVSNNRITVPARSTVKFQATVSVPLGTAVNRWSGIEVRAVSDNCTDGKVSTLLKLFVADPTQE